MNQQATSRIVDKFKLAFTEVFEDQILQLIQESRKEAFEQAKEILRDQTLNTVLEAVATAPDSDPSAQKASDAAADTPAQPVSSTANIKTPHKTDTPALNDRILQEIEAIREQILRNEQLLCQIKPFVQSSKTPEE